MRPEGQDVAIVDGKPELIIDAAGVAEMIRLSPLGTDVASDRIRANLPASDWAHIEAHL